MIVNVIIIIVVVVITITPSLSCQARLTVITISCFTNKEHAFLLYF